MLMQGALDKMANTKGCIERKHAKGKAEHVSKVTSILLYLRDTLDMQSGADISNKLFSLYDDMSQRLNDVHVQSDL